MQAIITRFDQVLHVKRWGSLTGPRSTTFSFRAGGGYTPYVTVDANPELRDGMNVLAFLRRQDDWKSLVGWKDLDTGKLAIPAPTAYRKTLLIQAAASIALLVAWLMGAPTAGVIAGLTILAGGLWTSAHELRQAERDRREIELLGVLRTESGAVSRAGASSTIVAVPADGACLRGRGYLER
jgi:hypothetical protein